MAKVTALHPTKAKPTFNPQASYKWEPTDIFEITGLQLASLYHCLTKEINDPQGSSIALKFEAFNAITEIFKRGVEQGVIIETDGVSPELVNEVDEKVDKLFRPTRFDDSLHHNHPNS